MHTLILGGSGFIGFALAKQLASEGHRLTLVDNLSRGKMDQEFSEFLSQNPECTFIELDLTAPIPDQLLPEKYNYVFTTGGIGPTHDDITSESLAEAFNITYEINSEAYNILEQYYPEGEFNISRQKMAKMPSDVELIYNPMTAAPGFKVRNVFVLPGVPKIMEQMLQDVLLKLKRVSQKKLQL